MTDRRNPARDTRTALLEAAQRLIGTRGYAGTSIRDLAAEVGIKESSVYNHFASKQALLDAVLARADQRVADVASTLGAPIDDPQQAADFYDRIDLAALERLAQGFLTLWLHDADFIAVRRVLTVEQDRTPAAGRQLRSLLVERPVAFQSALFAELIARGLMRAADPEAVALAFWGPVLAILIGATVDTEADAQRRLRLHLDHFRGTHLIQEES